MSDIQTKIWRPYEGDMQGRDFTAHMNYYCAVRSLSFIWDGISEGITVSQGGYGEPPEWMVPAPVLTCKPHQYVRAFELHCKSLLPAWDAECYDDHDYRYSEPHWHCADMDKVVPPPLGARITGYKTERRFDGMWYPTCSCPSNTHRPVPAAPPITPLGE